MEITNQNTCLNCKHPLELDAKFCAACGQKTTTGKITFGKILGDFFMNIFSLDSRLAHTLPALFFRPGRLTTEYFKGLHQHYVKPISLLFFSSLILFAVIFSMQEMITPDIDDSKRKIRNKIENYHNDLVNQIDTAKMQCKTQIADTTLHAVIDSAFMKFKTRNRMSNNFMYFSLFSDSKTIKVTHKDLATMEIDEILDKKEITHWLDRALFSQIMKVNLDGEGFFQYGLSKLSWVYFLLIPFSALFLKLFYIRRKKYYVEHIVFGVHYFSFLALALSAIILLSLLPWKWPMVLVILVSLVYLFLATKNYYKQGYRKTFAKYLLLLFSYLFSTVLAIVLVFMFTILLY